MVRLQRSCCKILVKGAGGKESFMNSKIRKFWGISEVGFFMMSSMETMFLVFFLTNVALLPLSIVGVITGFSALADAFSAILAGVVIDKVTFKNGKYRPWLLICPPLVMMFFTFCFTKIGGDVTAGIIVGIGYVLSHFIWNICWTANRDMVSVISKDPQDRAWLSSRIGLGSNIGKIMNSLVVPTMTSAMLGVMSGVTAYTVLALVFSGLFLICYYIHYFITDGCDTRENQVKTITFAEMGRNIVTNSQLIAVLLHDAIRQIAFIGIGSLTSYYCTVVLGNTTLASPLLVAFYIGGVLGSLIAPTVVKSIGSKKTNLVGVLGWGVMQALTLVLPANVYVVGVLLLIGQIFFGMSYGLTTGFYAMCGTYGEYKTGESANGLVMACCSLAIKIAVALRGVAITAFLGFIGYSATAEVTAEVQGNIRMMYGVFPVIFIIVSLLPLLFFKLDDKKVKEMEAVIAGRNK